MRGRGHRARVLLAGAGTRREEAPGPGRVANCGFGTNVMSANLTLAIPPLAASGPYGSIMTITAVTTGPPNEFCVPIGVTF